MPIDFDQARFAMIEQQVRPWEVLDPRVLDVLARVRREDFMGGLAAGLLVFACSFPAVLPFALLDDPGADPHSYEPSLRDIRDVAYARCALTNGLLLEQRKLSKMVEANLPAGVVSVAGIVLATWSRK